MAVDVELWVNSVWLMEDPSVASPSGFELAYRERRVQARIASRVASLYPGGRVQVHVSCDVPAAVLGVWREYGQNEFGRVMVWAYAARGSACWTMLDLGLREGARWLDWWVVSRVVRDVMVDWVGAVYE